MSAGNGPRQRRFAIFAATICASLAVTAAAAEQTLFTEYDIPTSNSQVRRLALGPDGAIYFTEFDVHKIGRVDVNGVMTEFVITAPPVNPLDIINGPVSAVWFTGPTSIHSGSPASVIGRLFPDGTQTLFVPPDDQSRVPVPHGITTTPDNAGTLWITYTNTGSIARMSNGGTFFLFVPPGLCPGCGTATDIVAGQGGDLWFTTTPESDQIDNRRITRLTPSTPEGIWKDFPIGGLPLSIARGPNSTIWFTTKSNTVGSMTPDGVVSEWPIPTPNTQAEHITAGSDGTMWLTEALTNKIANITASGKIKEFAVPSTTGGVLEGIVAGADGAMWFADAARNKIIRLSKDYMIVTGSAGVASGNVGGPFAADFSFKLQGTNGAIGWQLSGLPSWLNASATSGVLDFDPVTVKFTVNDTAQLLAPGTYGPVPLTFSNTKTGFGNVTRQVTLVVGGPGKSTIFASILPTSRSVQVGQLATAFATIINGSSAGGPVATACGLSLGGSIPATFSFQTTDASTNTPVGAANTPVNIPPGGSQSYVFAVTPSAPFGATDVPINANCGNSDGAATIVGLNTLLLSSSTTPVADIVVLAATPTNDGIVNIPGLHGIGVFAVATVNVGADGAITVSADSGSKTLPLQLTLCPTNPSTGQCTSPVAASTQLTINTNATPTFGIFVQGTDFVPFDPANNRVFVRFKDAGGVTRGSTSVAVRTQ